MAIDEEVERLLIGQTRDVEQNTGRFEAYRGKPGRVSRANVKAVQKVLGPASAAMVCADLFDDDLDAVAVALDHAASEASVGRMWARGAGA